MRLLYLPNEIYEGQQIGYRRALCKLVDSNHLSAVKFFSFQAQARLRKWELVLSDLIACIEDFKPTHILFGNTSKYDFGESFFKSVKNVLGYDPQYVMDQRDAFGRFAKPIPSSMLRLAAQCQHVFLVTDGGYMWSVFKKHVKGQLHYLGHVADIERLRIGANDELSFRELDFDIVMIANFSPSKIPFKSMPGVKERLRIASHLYEIYGDRFAVFGTGWRNYPFAWGPIAFEDQIRVLEKSRMSIGMDHFYDYSKYYSDRLPIALFSKKPHISYRTPGVDALFKENEEVIYFSSLNELIQKIDFVLEPVNKTIVNKLTDTAYNKVVTYYNEDARMSRLVNIISEY